MKRIIVVLAALSLLLPSAFIKAFAAGTVSFEAGSDKCAVNRLAEVSFKAKGSGSLSAALFEISYDAATLEFREAKAAKDSVIEVNTGSGNVKISYLCREGVDLSEQAELFTLTFKACSEGVSEVAYSVFDCIDAQIQQMDVGACVSGKVTVTSGAGSQTKASRKTQSSSAKSKTSTAPTTPAGKKKCASSSAVTETKAEETITDLGNINQVVQADIDKTTPLIVLCLSIVIAAAFIGFLVLKLKNRRKKDDNDIVN